MDFGTKTTKESYFKGDKTISKVGYSIPVMVNGKTQCLSEIMKALDLITSKQTSELTIVIKASKSTHQITMLTKSYEINS
jgi:hypothetical protein